jgi:hypothetical protein
MPITSSLQLLSRPPRPPYQTRLLEPMATLVRLLREKVCCLWMIHRSDSPSALFKRSSSDHTSPGTSTRLVRTTTNWTPMLNFRSLTTIPQPPLLLPWTHSSIFDQNRLEKAALAWGAVYLSFHSVSISINQTLAGVAQLVERVALMTAKRSTSRSWVRAPPSAIPISKSQVAAVLLLLVLATMLRWSYFCLPGRSIGRSLTPACVRNYCSFACLSLICN